MPLTLNTSHPLYSNIVAFICVDDDNIVKDLKGDTCTTDASVVIGTGTYGRHFQTQLVSNNAKGIALTNGHLTKPVSNPIGTSMIVINAGNSRASRGSVTNTPNGAVNSIGVYTGDVAGCQTSNNFPVALGTTDVIGTGAHCIAAAWNGTTEYKTWVNGNQEAVVSGNLGNATDTGKTLYIGGVNTGGFGGFAADYVYYIHFRKYLSEAELDEIYTSLGANNQISLLASGGAAPTGTVTIGTITPNSTGASVPFTYSAADQTGFEYQLNETGTIYPIAASPATPTGLTSSTAYTIRVRAKNASGEGDWSTSEQFTTSGVAVSFVGGPIPDQVATVGVPFSLDVAAYFTGALTPLAYDFSFGNLTGTGLSLNASTGMLEGTPTTTANLDLQIRATDTGTNTAVTNLIALDINAAVTPVSFTGTIPAISGTQNAAITPVNTSSYFTGSLTPFTYSLFSGTLPTGVTLNSSTGVISGTPTVSFSGNIVVRATDSGSNTANSNSIAVTIVAAAGTITITGVANNIDAPWTSAAVDAATIMPLILGSVVVNKTGLSTTAGADLVITDAAIITGTEYIIILKIGTAYGWYRAVAT